MTLGEAADILRRMYRNAPRGDKVFAVHLFGLRYANELEGLSNSEIAKQAGLPGLRYGTEISKGRKLAMVASVHTMPYWAE